MSRYQLIRELGRGAMGVVYRARQQGLDRDVALKFMLDEVAPDSKLVARFRREMQALIALSHPNVIRLLDAGEQDGKLFYAMELLDAVDLQQVVDAGKTFSAEQTAAVLAQLLDALEYVHGRGMVHRDIKPQNVMLERARGAILMDFGLARKVDGTLFTEKGRMLGTPRFMAPELWRGEDHGPAADLFALGCTAYSMLSGNPPFMAPDLASLVPMILTEEPRPLTEACPGLDPALAAFIHSLLVKDPGRRPTSATARTELVRVTTAADPLPTVRTTLDGAAPVRARARTTRRTAVASAATAQPAAASVLTGPRIALAVTLTGVLALGGLLVRPSVPPAPTRSPAAAATPVSAVPPAELARRLIQSVRSSRLTEPELTRAWLAIKKRLIARGWSAEKTPPAAVIASQPSIAQPFHDLVAAARGANDLAARLAAVRPHTAALLESASTNDELRADLLNAMFRLDAADALAGALGVPPPFDAAGCLAPAFEVTARAASPTSITTAGYRQLFPPEGRQGLMLYHPDQDPRRGGDVGDSMSAVFMSSTGRTMRDREHATAIALEGGGSSLLFLVADMHPNGYLRLTATGTSAPLHIRLPAGAPSAGQRTWIAVRLRGALARRGAQTLEHRRAYEEYARPYVLVEAVLAAS